ncbi:MAG: hypothetical protein EOO90_06985 [Pedobacter sp.]|nr:MAG: hypothetical protein EOO90_06985 [Pedobacter sp.]
MENREENTKERGTASHSNTPPGTTYAEDTEINKEIADDLESEADEKEKGKKANPLDDETRMGNHGL